jgi:hypothetical protein
VLLTDIAAFPALIPQTDYYPTEFIKLIALSANDECEKDKKKTIAPEHVISAMEVGLSDSQGFDVTGLIYAVMSWPFCLGDWFAEVSRRLVCNLGLEQGASEGTYQSLQA